MSIVIRSVGSALPARAVRNDDLPAALETSDEWIKSRTGIAQRYLASEGETTSTLAISAARNALENAGMDASEIDGIILATTTPDLTFPSVATMVQRELGVPAGVLAMDVQAVCAGFIYALGTADALLQAGRMKRALVIGSETMSRILNWEDRTTCVLFGDGAGAVVMERDERGRSRLPSPSPHKLGGADAFGGSPGGVLDEEDSRAPQSKAAKMHLREEELRRAFDEADRNGVGALAKEPPQ